MHTNAGVKSFVCPDVFEGTHACEKRSMGERVRDIRRTLDEIRQRLEQRGGGSLKVMRAELTRVREAQVEIKLAMNEVRTKQNYMGCDAQHIREVCRLDSIPTIYHEEGFDVVPF